MESRLLRQGVAYAEAHAFTWDVILGRSLLAQLLRRRGDVERARVEFDHVRQLARATGQRLAAEDCEIALQALANGA